MNLYIRLFIKLFQLLFCPKVDIYSKTETTFRPLPNDIDLNLHLNNARYLSFMDLGRFDFLGKTGLLKHLVQDKWSPIVGNIDIKFIKEIKPFEKVILTTEVDHFDHKYFYITQTFVNKDRSKTFAIAKVKGLFVCPKGKMTPEEVILGSGNIMNKDLYVDADDASALENWRKIAPKPKSE